MPRGVVRHSLSSPLSSSLTLSSSPFHTHWCTYLTFLYPLNCKQKRSYAIAPIPKNVYYKGLTNALSKPQQQTPSPPVQHKPLFFNSNIQEALSPTAEVKSLQLKHEKGFTFAVSEILRLIPLVDSPSATILYKIAKEQGHLSSTYATACYNSLISAHGKHKNLEESLRLFEEMNKNNVPPNVATYNSLIGIFAHNDRLADALALFHGMEKNGIYANERTYAVLLNAYTKKLDISNVTAVLASMNEKGVSPGAPIYTMLIEMYLSLDQEQDAFKILEVMKKGTPQQQPDAVTWGALLGHYEKKGDLQKMRETFANILKDKDKLVANPFSRMIYGYNKRGMFKEAVEIFELAKKENIRLSDNLLNSALHSYSMLGDFIGAMTVRRIMAARYIKYDTQGMNALMRVWLKEKMYSKVYTTLNDMDHFRIPKNEASHSLAIDLYACEKLFAKVEKELETMKVREIPITNITLYSLAKHFKTKEEVEEMLKRSGWEINEEIKAGLQSIYDHGNN